MYKELRITLTDSSAIPVVIKHMPSGWADASMTMERQKKYYGVFRSFSLPMKWAKDSATILRTEFYNHGLASLVYVKIEKLDKISLTYEVVFSGKIDFTTYKDQDFFVEANVLDGGLAEIIKNREGDELDCTTDYYFGILPWGKNLVDVAHESDIGWSNYAYAIHVSVLFKSIVNKMTSEGALPSSLLYGSKSDLLSTSEFTKYWITNESAIKHAGRSGIPPFAIKTSLSDFFASINAITPIGLGIEILNGKECLVLEKREYFYNQNTTIIQLGEAKNIGISICSDLNFSQIKCGWPNESYNSSANSGNDTDSSLECNTETEYSIPNVSSNNEYDILGKYRADYQGIRDIVNTEDVDTQDYGLFLLSLYMPPNSSIYRPIMGQLRKKSDYATLYDKALMSVTPRRCLERHRSFINSCCLGLVGQTISFQSGTNDQANNETLEEVGLLPWVEEYTGFTIAEEGYLKPILIDLEVPYPQRMISLINANPTGVIGFEYKGITYYGYIYETETKLGGRGSVKFQLLSTRMNDLTQLIR